MHTTPPSLLERLRGTPEQQAWERFVEIYTPLMYAWTQRLGLSAHDAADLVQDVFMVLVERMDSFRYDQQQSFRAWLKTVLMNRWRNRRRRDQAHPTQPLVGAEAGREDVPEFEEKEYRQYVVARVFALMQAEFEPITWKACWEYVVNGRPAEAVSQELGITVNAVYLAKSRVLRRLRAELNGLLES